MSRAFKRGAAFSKDCGRAALHLVPRINRSYEAR
jgi:hypothetical protein